MENPETFLNEALLKVAYITGAGQFEKQAAGNVRQILRLAHNIPAVAEWAAQGNKVTGDMARKAVKITSKGGTLTDDFFNGYARRAASKARAAGKAVRNATALKANQPMNILEQAINGAPATVTGDTAFNAAGKLIPGQGLIRNFGEQAVKAAPKAKPMNALEQAINGTHATATGDTAFNAAGKLIPGQGSIRNFGEQAAKTEAAKPMNILEQALHGSPVSSTGDTAFNAAGKLIPGQGSILNFGEQSLAHSAPMMEQATQAAGKALNGTGRKLRLRVPNGPAPKPRRMNVVSAAGSGLKAVPTAGEQLAAKSAPEAQSLTDRIMSALTERAGAAPKKVTPKVPAGKAAPKKMKVPGLDPSLKPAPTQGQQLSEQMAAKLNGAAKAEAAAPVVEHAAAPVAAPAAEVATKTAPAAEAAATKAAPVMEHAAPVAESAAKTAPAAEAAAVKTAPAAEAAATQTTAPAAEGAVPAIEKDTVGLDDVVNWGRSMFDRYGGGKTTPDLGARFKEIFSKHPIAASGTAGAGGLGIGHAIGYDSGMTAGDEAGKERYLSAGRNAGAFDASQDLSDYFSQLSPRQRLVMAMTGKLGMPEEYESLMPGADYSLANQYR